MVPWFSHRVPPLVAWYILKMIYISRNLMPVGCFTGPTTLDFMKFNISRPRNYGLMDFTTESTESWMCSNGIYIYFEIYFSNLAVLSLNSFFSSHRSKKLVRLVHRLIWSSLAHTEIREKKISQERCFSQNLPPRSSRELRIRLIWNKKQKKILLLRHFSSPLPGNNSNKFPINLARDYIRIRRPIVIDSARFIIGNWLEQFDRER